MRILLDENLPHRLRLLIPGHDVRTVAFQGWKALSNGAILQAAEEAGFELFLTADQGLQYEQNLAGRKLAVIILSSNERSVIEAHLPKVVGAIEACLPGGFLFLELGD